MCGISGFISERNLIHDKSINNTLKLMSRRGPDSKDFFEKKYGTKNVALLHTRLNIIDLNERSNQPFINNDVILIFNGDIYN